MDIFELLKSLDAPLTIVGAAYVIYLGNQRLSAILDHQAKMFDQTMALLGELLKDCMEGLEDDSNN